MDANAERFVGEVPTAGDAARIGLILQREE